MKKYSNLLVTIAISAAGCLTGCNDNEFLKEKPETSFTYSNAFSVSSQVNDCLANVYYGHKQNLLNTAFGTYGLGTDILDERNERGMAVQLTVMSNWNTNSRLGQWNQWYNVIAMANLVLLGADRVEWANENDKQMVIAEARFLRGYFYLNLGELWGGVPIIDIFSESPRTDCVRATRKDTYLFAIADLEAAAAVLPDHQKPGRVGKGAAWHFIAEAYLALATDQNDAAYLDKSIAAANEVMKYHSLMKTRFGTRANSSSSGSYQSIPDYFPDGDVYFDLFQRGNFDYEEGNTESLWVDQNDVSYYEKYTGGLVGLPYPREWGPQSTGVRWLAEYIEAGAGNGPFNGGGITNDRFGINGNISAYTGGRSIGNNRPSRFAMYGVWENCGNDIRNSPINIRRSFKVLDPKHSLYGFELNPDNIGDYCTEFSLRDWHPVFTKTNPIDDWGYEGLELGISNRSNIYHDFYYTRVAETYLLRAEAKLRKGDKTGAAADINEIRDRARAPLITADEVTIDYILDERVRELYGEERRWQTLLRMGGDIPKNRIVKYGIHMVDYPENKNGEPWTDFLWPIPQSTIDSNIDAVLEQNPGWN